MEKWKDVVGYEGRYEVSDRGRVRSLKYNRQQFSKVLQPRTHDQGYLGVCLCADGKTRQQFIHALVLSAFVGPRPRGFCCDHRDGNRANNAVGNLEWVTYSENAFRGVRTCGEKNHHAKMTKAKVITIRKLHAQGGITQRELARQCEVSQPSISRIVSRATWRHVR